jgi:hypothetical protein
MLDVSTEILIERPRSEVANYSANPDNAPAWYKNIHQARWLTAPPLAVGSRIAFVAVFLGRRLEYSYEVVSFDAGRRLVMRTAEGPFPMETTYEWSEAGPSATRMTLGNRGSPAGFSRLLTPLLAARVQCENRADLAQLKQILETS